MSWLAIDIGGANLKAADGRGYAAVRPFALWREPAKLADELRAVISAAPPAACVAATMTGELCDCFETKTHGVEAILDALEAAAGDREAAVYLTDGRLVPADAARLSPLAAAASNWHALASFAARFAEKRPALLIDVGSTTSDVIPLDEEGPAATGHTDPERLLAGELVYTGVERTPVSAVVSYLPWHGGHCPVASELFATAADAYLMLGDLAEDAQNLDTADGRPRTRSAAHARLARMVCADVTMFSEAQAHRAARAIQRRQLKQLQAAITQVVGRMRAIPECVILSGHGEFLSRRLIERLSADSAPQVVVSLTEKLGLPISRVATAHALATLANEQTSMNASE